MPLSQVACQVSRLRQGSVLGLEVCSKSGAVAQSCGRESETSIAGDRRIRDSALPCPPTRRQSLLQARPATVDGPLRPRSSAKSGPKVKAGWRHDKASRGVPAMSFWSAGGMKKPPKDPDRASYASSNAEVVAEAMWARGGQLKQSKHCRPHAPCACWEHPQHAPRGQRAGKARGARQASSSGASVGAKGAGVLPSAASSKYRVVLTSCRLLTAAAVLGFPSRPDAPWALRGGHGGRR